MANKYYTLLQLNKSIRLHFQKIERDLWIVAELSAAQLRKHLYLELVQKEGELLVAKSRAVMWEHSYRACQEKLGIPLEAIMQKGNKVLICIRAQFHEVHGLSLMVVDLDPSYTLGELEQRRRQTIAKLEAAGLLEKQKELTMALVPQKIAVICSESAAGYADFINHLLKNEYGYHFEVRLFSASVQGAKAVAELKAALKGIAAEAFEAIVMIRGGGSRLDLEAYNDEGLATDIANCPLPVLTGIGHQTDESVADLAAHLAFKTPTAVADFLVQRAMAFEAEMLELFEAIKQEVQQSLVDEKELLNEVKSSIGQQSRAFMQAQQLGLSNLQSQLKKGIKYYLQGQEKELFYLQKGIELLDPQKVMARGFSLTLHQGRPIGQQASMEIGDELQVLTKDFELTATLKKINIRKDD